MSLMQRKDGTFAHHAIMDGEARVIFHNDFWHVHIPDGLYAKEVYLTPVREDAVEFCARMGWSIAQ